MKWVVKFHQKFAEEFDKFAVEIQDQLLSHALLLEKFSPTLGRPWVDTLKNSKYPNMKEMRFRTKGGVWRIVFAYDPKREAILLVGGNKAGVNESRFYKELIRKADERLLDYLQEVSPYDKYIKKSVK